MTMPEWHRKAREGWVVGLKWGGFGYALETLARLGSGPRRRDKIKSLGRWTTMLGLRDEWP